MKADNRQGRDIHRSQRRCLVVKIIVRCSDSSHWVGRLHSVGLSAPIIHLLIVIGVSGIHDLENV
jgi:hypothetical protein